MSAEKYKDIIKMHHHVSKKHPHMSNYDRAAQFSPFAALTGHDAAVAETARLTDLKIELDEGEKIALNEKLQQLAERLVESRGVHGMQSGIIHGNTVDLEVTYFEEDVIKDGGAYRVKRGCVKKINNYSKVLVFEDMSEVKLEDITKIKFI